MHRQRLTIYEKILQRNYTDDANLSCNDQGRLLGLKAGLIAERGWINWCDDAELTLSQLQK
jgi:Virulence activator alpha C-term